MPIDPRTGQEVPLLSVVQGNLLESGVWPAVHELDAPLWVDASNVEFRDGAVLKARGWDDPSFESLLFDDAIGLFDDAPGLFDNGGPAGTFSSPITGPIRGIFCQLTSNGAQRLFFADQDEIALSTGGAAAVVGSGYNGSVDEAAGALATCWSAAKFLDTVFFTNGIDPIQTYAGVSFSALGGSAPATAEIILNFGAYMLAFNTDAGATIVEWCAEGDFNQWDHSVAPTAGSLQLVSLDSEIVAAVPLGAGIGVYSRNSMVNLRYIRPPFVFGEQPGPQGIGSISKHGVVPVGSLNYGFGPDGLFRTDGNSYVYIDPPPIRKYLQDHLNFGQKSKVWGWHNISQQRVVWEVPLDANTEPSRGVGFNYVNNSFTFYDRARTAAFPKGVFDYPMLGTTNGYVWAHEQGVNGNGAAISAYAHSKPLDCGDPRQAKFVDQIRLRLRDVAGTGLRVSVGYQDALEDEISWGADIPASDGFDVEFVRLSGVFIRFRISCDQIGDDFLLAGFELLGELDGGAP